MLNTTNTYLIKNVIQVYSWDNLKIKLLLGINQVPQASFCGGKNYFSSQRLRTSLWFLKIRKRRNTIRRPRGDLVSISITTWHRAATCNKRVLFLHLFLQRATKTLVFKNYFEKMEMYLKKHPGRKILWPIGDNGCRNFLAICHWRQLLPSTFWNVCPSKPNNRQGVCD